MKKIKRSIFLTVILCITCQTQVQGSRLFSALANEGAVLTDGYHASYFSNFINDFQALGNYHDTGWGMLAYQGEAFDPLEPIGIEFRGNGDASDEQSTEYLAAKSAVFSASNVSTYMSHLRLASSGCGSGPEEDYPEDPHPWVWYEPNITYTFAHNGTIYYKSQLRDLIGTTWIANHGGLNTFEEAGCGGEWDSTEGFAHVIDSELYFFWLMKNILETNGDVLQGLKNALSDPDFQSITSDNNLNFTFSDGASIWAFRLAASGDDTNPNFAHTLFYSDFSYQGTHLGLKAVASQRLFQTIIWTELNNHELVYLPRTGNSVVFQNFDTYQNTVEIKPLNTGWNWECFPVLTDNDNTSINNVMLPLNPYGESFQGQFIASSFDEIWDPDIPISSIAGFKVQMSDESEHYNLLTSGVRIPTDEAIFLNQGENWVGYFIEEEQEPLDALPSEVVDRLIGLKAQDWYMIKKGSKWIYSSCQSGQGPCRTLRYGELYILKLSSGPSLNMVWNTGTGGPPGGGELLAAGGSFEVQELSDYSALEIETIDDPETVSEVGAFLGENCVGAEEVTVFPLYLQVYNGDVSMEDLTFQVVRETGLARRAGNDQQQCNEKIVQHYQVQDIKSESTETGFAYYKASIKASSEPIIAATRLLSAYPNPFNPSMTLRYELANESNVTIMVYNIQGRVVENLYSGIRKRGQYELLWDASQFASGLYFVKFRSQNYEKTQKVMLMK